MRSPDFQESLDENWPSRRLHVILLCTFAGLLVLLLAAGLIALHYLRQLRAAEAGLAQSLSARTETLSSLVSAVNLYDERIQQYLIADQAHREDFTVLSREIHLLLREYPAGRSPEEQQMLSLLDRQSREQEQIVVQIFAWKNDDRRRKALDYIRDKVIPHQLELIRTREKIALWNQQQLEIAGNRQLENFDGMRRQLTRFLLLALLAGMLLASGSLAYVLRLAKQSRNNYRELAHSRGELQQLSARLVDVQEAERRAISRELHDAVGQSLGALLVDAGRLSAMLPPGLPAVQERVDKIKDVAESTLQTVRDIALLLRPSMLDDLGLVPALEWQGREVERRSDADVQVDAEGVPEQMSDEYKTVIYRVAQEALHNAARHSGAKHIKVKVRQHDGRIYVEVTDDGRGFDPRRTRGMGILGMEERVKRLHGSFTIESAPGTGAAVRFELPASGGVGR
jgi:signal transduction histidine kinase